jgi:hypothetical protein
MHAGVLDKSGKPHLGHFLLVGSHGRDSISTISFLIDFGAILVKIYHRSN